jgi:branched-chain amino acid transport system permease protein
MDQLAAIPARASLRMPGLSSTRRVVLAASLLAMAVALLAFPAVLSDAMLGALGKAMIAAVFALAFNLLAGQAGMLSFGHAAYFAIGTFATVHGMNAIERGFPLPTPLVPLIGAGAGFLAGIAAGYFATKRSGVYFAMVTLAIAELLHSLAPNLEGFFGGEVGLSSFRQPFMGITFGKESEVYYLILAWTAIAVLLLWAYTRSLFGRLTLACRESEKRLPALGYDIHKTKILIFSVSGLFSGLAGGLLAVSTESANYALFHSAGSAAVVLHTFIGGSGLFLGPALGAFCLTLFGFVTSDLTRSWLFYQGLLFIVVMLLAPHGLARWIADEGERLVRGGGRAVLRLALLLAALLLATTAVVLLAELAHTLLSRDYQAVASRSGVYAPIKVLGHAWAPGAVVTWLVPLLLIAASAVVARLVKRFGEASP